MYGVSRDVTDDEVARACELANASQFQLITSLPLVENGAKSGLEMYFAIAYTAQLWAVDYLLILLDSYWILTGFLLDSIYRPPSLC